MENTERHILRPDIGKWGNILKKQKRKTVNLCGH